MAPAHTNHHQRVSDLNCVKVLDGLGLAHGDRTGMWNINYPFPYATPEVEEQYAGLAKALGEAVEAQQDKDAAKKRAAYLEARKKFQAVLNAYANKYCSFHIWI